MIANRPWAVLLFLAGIGLSCAASALAQTQAAPQSTGQIEGKRVAAIRILDQSGEVLQDQASGLPLQVNQSFTTETERQSLRQLYRTGLYADIVVQVTDVPQGLQVDFLVRPNFFVDEVRVNGLHEPPSDSVAGSSMPLG